MRSRYSAYAKGLDAYLLHSWHPDTRPSTIELDPRHRWTGLTIIAAIDGGPGDETGTVEFRAAFEIDRGAGRRPGEMHEVSAFSRLADVGSQSGGGRWVYVAESASGR